MKLSSKLAGLIIAITILTVASVGLLSFRAGRQSLQDRAIEDLTRTTLLKQAEFQRWLHGNEQDLMALAQRPSVRQDALLLLQYSPTDPTYREAANRLKRNHLSLTVQRGGLLELFILHPENGEVLIATDPAFEGLSRAGESFYIEGQQGTFTQNPAYSDAVEEVVMHASTPIWDENGRLLAVLVAHLDLAEISRIMLQGSELNTTEETYLVNAANLLVTDSRFAEPVTMQTLVQTVGANDCLAGNNDAAVYDDYRGTPVLGAYRWIPDMQMCIITEVDQAEAFAPVQAALRQLIVLSIGAIFVASVLGILFSRSLTQPLGSLTMGAQQIAQGNLDYRVTTGREDEVGALAQAFNQMAQNLELSNAENVHTQKLLLGLNQAAQAMQQARAPQDVYAAMSAEIRKLDYHVSVFLLNENPQQLRLAYTSFDQAAVAAVQALTGIDVATYHAPRQPDGFFDQVLQGNETTFIASMHEFLAQVVPHADLSSLAQVVARLGMGQGILAPLLVEGSALGALLVIGESLTARDGTAVSTFASQTAAALENAELIVQLRQNETRFRAIFEHAALGIVRLGLDGRVIQANAALERMSGYTAAELHAMHYADLIRLQETPGDVALHQLLTNGMRDAYSLLGQYVRKDGERLPAQVSMSLVRDALGNPDFLIGTVQEISQERNVQEAQNRQRDFLESIYNGTDMAIFVVEVSLAGEFRFSAINIAYERLTGLESKDVLGKTPYELAPFIPLDALEKINANYARCIAAGESISYEERIPIAGRITWWLTRLSPLANANGRIYRIVGTALPITERKLAEEKLHQSEALRRVALEGAQLGTWSIDLVTGSVFWDKRAREIFGVSMQQPISQELGLRLVHPDDRDRDQKAYIRATDPITGSGEYNIEKRIVSENGDVFWVAMKGRVLFAEDGNGRRAVQFTGIVMDITPRKKAEEAQRRYQDELEELVAERAAALKMSEARYRTLTESSPDMIFLINSDYTLAYVNPVAARQFGENAADVIGNPQTALFPAQLTARQQQVLRHVFASREMQQIESKVSTPQADIWLHTRLVPIMAEDDDTVTAVLGVSRDITFLKEAELALEKKAADLQRSNTELEQFAYVASHDLQEPLRMISSYLQLLRRRYHDQLDDDADEFIDYAVDGAERMKRLIQDLLAFSRVGTRGDPFTAVDANAILQQALNNLQTAIQEADVTITADNLPEITGDAGQLVQLFQNLISNAIKFRQETDPKVHIGVTQAEDMWRFSVADNGIGVDPQFAERIFVIFKRLHSRLEYSGTGIGLALCKKIVERHGGRIWVESQPDAGATFFFEVPMDKIQYNQNAAGEKPVH